MMRRMALFFFTLFSLMIFMNSCQPRPETPKGQEEKNIQINLQSDPQTLDPRKARDLQERILMNMLFEGLTREGKSGASELALADRFEVSEEGCKYTFYLREAFWTNGDPILAKDFVYAWKTALDPLFPSPNAYQLFCLQHAKEIKQGEKPASELGALALEDRVLQVRLEHPVPYFLELLSFSIFFPVHEKMDQIGWDFKQKQTALISSGPFSLREWKHNDFIEVVKNPNHWEALVVKLPGIRLVMVSEETEVRMFEKGELDWAGSPLSTLPTDLLDSFRKKNILHSYPILGTAFFRVNVEKFPFNNANIRKAFALALNRKALVEHVIQGGRPALRLIPEEMKMQQDPYFADADEERARIFFSQGLQELGLSKEEFPKISFLYSAMQRNQLISQAVQQDWLKVLGVFVELESNERKVYFSRLGQKDYQIALGSWQADFNDPVNFLEVFKYKKASSNHTEWENTEYATLLDASNREGTEKRREMLRRCEKILMEEMPIIPLYHNELLYVKKGFVQDVLITSLGNIDFKWACLRS